MGDCTSSSLVDEYSDSNIRMEEKMCESQDSESDGGSIDAIENIEEMVLLVLRQLAMSGCQPPADNGSRDDDNNKRTCHTIELRLANRKKADTDSFVTTKILRYPRRCRGGSSKSFAQLFKVLDLVHEATLSGVPATKRDIFYRDVPLFKTQRVVDTLVDDIAATFQLERSDLNIRSSSKGLICGSGVKMMLSSGDVIQCTDSEGTLIPAGEDIESFSVDEDLAWVLVIEKEAVFQTLCQLRVTRHEELPGRGVIITGKGYPDIATRHLVKSMADSLPRTIPILGLVDGDPYGLDILSVYKYGSKSMRHESDKLAARRLKWLGLWASELASLGIAKDKLLPISKHDEKKALSMLHRQENPLPERWKKELQHMLHSRRRAEIEILTATVQVEFVDRQNSQGGEEFHSVPTSSFSSASDRNKPSEPHALLLYYLVSKINHFVKFAGSQSSQRFLWFP